MCSGNDRLTPSNQEPGHADATPRSPHANPKSPIRTPRTGSTHALSDTLDMMGAPMSFSRNEEIYGEAEPADYLYTVVSGAVRMYRVLNDGRRQIGAFYLPGDMFGLEPGEDQHASSAEAIGDVTVLVFKRSAVFVLSARDTDVARQLWKMTEHARTRGFVFAGNGQSRI